MQDIMRPDAESTGQSEIDRRRPTAIALRLRLINLAAVTLPFVGRQHNVVCEGMCSAVVRARRLFENLD